ncbi:MAG TPA: hypothetical protein VIG73_13545 [Cerasibacillus sp.]|uniref:hypothetical protein n=1 Tax=Cerasibacillus sp. TaxID=2498711 RepID=UPI002F40502B
MISGSSSIHHCDNPQLKNCDRQLHYTTFSYEEIQPINHHDENTDAFLLIENIRTEIPNGRFVELFSPATEKNHWQKMRFVFLQHEDEWYLRAIIRHADSFDEH